MRTLSRVVWSEGMHLSQHHFQMQSRYFEDAARFQLELLHFAPYGLLGAEFDIDALSNGSVSVVHLRGILPDGTPFQLPDPEIVPAPIALEARFPPTADRCVVFLGLSPFRPGAPNLLSGENGGAEGTAGRSAGRFSSLAREVVDEASGTGSVTIQVARKNLRLLLEGEEREGEILLPIARVRRDGAGRFEYDPDFIPPSLRLRAVPATMALLDRLIALLESRGEVLRTEREESRGRADYGSREIATFWLAHAIHSALPAFHHLRENPESHPEALFVELSRLAGALCTFSLQAHPRDLPSYDHGALGRVLLGLEEHVKRNLQVVLPDHRVQIPLDATRELLRTATVTDRRCLAKGAHWFLGVRASIPEGELAASAPRLLKVCSARHIARLVKEAYPGMGIRHVPSPPAALSPRIGTVYFALERSEPCWSSIVDGGEVGIYVPGALPGAEIDLLVVLDGGSLA